MNYAPVDQSCSIAPYYGMSMARNMPVVNSNVDLQKLQDASLEVIVAEMSTYYRQGNSQAALQVAELALTKAPKDAVLWSWKAVIELQKGDAVAAEASASFANACKIVNDTSDETVAIALERVQGTPRRFLQNARFQKRMPSLKRWLTSLCSLLRQPCK